eukprot:scaffold37977_cov239-Skeletonema_dohrnii-CCMP3373.AAC.1
MSKVEQPDVSAYMTGARPNDTVLLIWTRGVSDISMVQQPLDMIREMPLLAAKIVYYVKRTFSSQKSSKRN